MRRIGIEFRGEIGYVWVVEVVWCKRGGLVVGFWICVCGYWLCEEMEERVMSDDIGGLEEGWETSGARDIEG